MEKSTFTPLYDLLRARLVEVRKSAGLTRRDLAARLGRERSFVARVEGGERRVDLVEFYWICRACGAWTAGNGDVSSQNTKDTLAAYLRAVRNAP